MKSKIILVMIAILTILALTGCGTTAKSTSDSSNNGKDNEAQIAEKTAWINPAQVTLNNNVAPDNDYISCDGFDTAESKSLIEVFKGYPFTVSNLVATGNANSLGVFLINVGNNDDVDNQVFYVTSTGEGKRRSDALILTK